MKNSRLIIKEVDCYIANSWNYDKYATSEAVQHQIMLIKGSDKHPIGRENEVADDDRYSRVVFEVNVCDEVSALWMVACALREVFQSEMCSTVREYEAAAKHNKPLRVKLDDLLEQVYFLVAIDMPFDQFKRLSIY